MAIPIRHQGRVVSVSAKEITVAIMSESACSTCHARGMCSLGEKKVKEVKVAVTRQERFEPGEEVDVLLSPKLGMKAVWLAYGLPLLVFLAALIVFVSIGLSELATGLLIIAILGVYYFCLYSLRYSIAKDYVFTVEKRNN